MPPVKLSDLTSLYFLLNDALDQGESIPISEAEAAIDEARVTELIARYDEKELLELYEEDAIARMNDLLVHKRVDKAERLGVQENGLAFIAANIVAIMQNNKFRDPETGEEKTLADFEVVQDWRPD